MIYVFKNEAVCCEVQTHFGSFHLSSFIKKVLGAFSRSMRPKMKLFALEFRHILEVLCDWRFPVVYILGQWFLTGGTRTTWGYEEPNQRVRSTKVFRDWPTSQY